VPVAEVVADVAAGKPRLFGDVLQRGAGESGTRDAAREGAEDLFATFRREAWPPPGLPPAVAGLLIAVSRPSTPADAPSGTHGRVGGLT
jgi:hypothetical protein